MKKHSLFTRKDMEQIIALGLSPRKVERQLAVYRRKVNFLRLRRPCTINDGILSLTSSQRKDLVEYYEREAGNNKILKFVPASGAASRMFVEWYAAAQKGGFGNPSLDNSFLRKLKKTPFFPLIEQNTAGRKILKQKNIQGLLNFILSADGLNLGWLPKALIPFHFYPRKEIRTAIEEHLFEAASYASDPKGICRLHFTVSMEHEEVVAAKLREVKAKYEKLCRVKYKIDLSVQSPATSIIAADRNNLPFRESQGRLVFRPGGHGTLLENLGNLDADLIFIKNIDNIVPTDLLRKIVPYKKMLGGLALKTQQEIFAILNKLGKEKLNKEQLGSIAVFCKSKLNIDFEPGFSSLSTEQKKKKIFSFLNRPLRVCGMVRNMGEPGGGPFWVKEKNRTQQTMQIIEFAHVNEKQPPQLAVWSRASYFNPVDMVCCTKDYRGQKFDLEKFVDRDAYLITTKTEKGRRLKAQELPGLWNGSMAYWNTIFVELPLIVFNPVKTVDDLLRPRHQGGRKNWRN